MTHLSSITSRHEFAAYRKPPDGKTASWLAGNTPFVMASITVMCVAILTVFSADVSSAFADGYYFVLRQLSAALDLVS